MEGNDNLRTSLKRHYINQAHVSSLNSVTLYPNYGWIALLSSLLLTFIFTS